MPQQVGPHLLIHTCSAVSSAALADGITSAAATLKTGMAAVIAIARATPATAAAAAPLLLMFRDAHELLSVASVWEVAWMG